MSHGPIDAHQPVRAKALARTLRRDPRYLFQEHFSASLWLVRTLDGIELTSPVFRTGGSSSREVSELPKAAFHARLVDRLAFDPSGVVLHPLIKSGGNPWAEKILIGRAANNDVVLRFESVSKLHAYVRMFDAKWCLFDAGSANGTWVEGQPLTANAEKGTVISSGCEVRFGDVRCEIIGNTELYELMCKGK